jgi:VWA domain containing CoxE-like protein
MVVGMIQSPIISAAKWHQQPHWKRYFRDLFAYYARHWYTVIIGGQFALAAVNSSTKQVYINPEQTPPVSGLIRHRPSSEGEFLSMMMQALIAHEAGHVHFSGKKPQEPLLGQLWNTLEDERMERLMAARFPELERWFNFIGDTVLVQSMPTSDLLAGCLLHRWEHDRPGAKRFNPNPEQLELWDQVKTLVEASWIAEHSDDVTEIARAILALLGKAEAAPEQPGLQGFDRMNEDFSGDGEPQPQAQASSGHGTPSDAQEDPEHPNGATKDPEDPEGVQPPSQPQAGDQGQGQETSDNLGNTEAQLANSSDDLEPNAETTQTPNPCFDSRGFANQHTTTQADQSEKGDQPSNSILVRSSSSDEPSLPVLMPSQPKVPVQAELDAEPILERVEGAARELAALLSPFEPRKLHTPSRNAGRLSPQRVMAGRERVFERKNPPPKLETLFIDVLIDISGSMDPRDTPGSKMNVAVHTAMMVERACELAGIARRVTAFDDDVLPICDQSLDARSARGRIAGMDSYGGTNLGQALGFVLEHPTAVGAKRLVVVVSDGALAEEDQRHCTELVKDKPRVLFLPVLLGVSESEVQAYRSIFGHATPINEIELLPSVMRILLARVR